MTTTLPQFHPLYAARLHLLADVPEPGILDSPETLALRMPFEAPFGEPMLPDVDVETAEVAGPAGPVPVRIYRHRDERARSRIGLMWMHGGAFMYGDLDVPEADHFARQMAFRTGATVISVDYRLCSRTVRLPAPHDDCLAVHAWCRRHAADLGIDADRLAVGGGSAGANLAASVALHAAQTGQRPWQMLLAYPVVHPVLPPADPELAAALAQMPDAIRFRSEGNRTINEFVLGRPIEAATAHEFPALAPDASAFPPAYIENSEFDDLRASGEAFAEQLRAAGVPVECVTARGVPHGHLNAVGSPMLEEAYARFAARLQG